jgi:hypothetical protein
MPDPQKYRAQATYLRIEAALVSDPDLKNQMLIIAGQYERLAGSLVARKKDLRNAGELGPVPERGTYHRYLFR